MRFDNRPEGAATMSPGMPGATNYYNWIFSQMEPYLGQKILDIGGGYGAHLDPILQLGRNVLSVDFSATSVQFMNQRFKDSPNFHAAFLDFGELHGREQLISGAFDTITCLNVLEHIEDDVQALKDMHIILKDQQGTLFLQVPAHEWLYGTLDSQAGHYRRYSTTYLRSILTSAGFTTIEIYYFNSFGVLPWYINGRVLKQKLESTSVGVQLHLFDRYFIPILKRVEKRVKLPFGQSLMAVAKA